MILTKSVPMKMNGKHISKYRNNGYICEVNEIIDVKVEDIPKLSLIKVLVACDYCGGVKEIHYNAYSRSLENGGVYSCISCKSIKSKKTSLEKYGVENYTQTKEYLEKSKKTSLEKYGVENYTQTKEYLEKSKKTNLEKYGVENVFQSEIIKDKIKETNLEKYGTESASQSDIVKEKTKNNNLEKYGVEHTLMLDSVKNKIKETNLEKYGVENVFQSEIIKDKIKETNLEKYGFINSAQSEIIKDKIKETNLEKYGFENAAQNYLIKDKIKKSRIFNGSWISDIDRNTFDRYEKDIENKTKVLKSLLFEKWDGNDYYDGEYIKNNIKLKHTDKNFPTIDHKISIYSGYKNNLSVDEIANIDNLCITKRFLNSKKNRLTEEEFYKRHEKYKK